MKKAMLVFALIMGVALVAGPSFAQTAPATTVLKGNPMGGVNFDHAKHAKLVGDAKCDTCHHASKPEMALKSKNQKCQDVPREDRGGADEDHGEAGVPRRDGEEGHLHRLPREGSGGRQEGPAEVQRVPHGEGLNW